MEDYEVGKRLEALRTAKGLSIRAVARQTGMAAGYLSAVERGRNSITVGKLKTLVRVLGVSLSAFFAEEGDDNARIIYRRASLVELSSDPMISLLEVGAGRVDRMVQLTWEHYHPGADTGKEMYRSEGQDAGIVLKGQMELTVGDEVHVLGPGDGYYYDLSHRHRIRNVGDGELEAVSACSPATF